MGRATLGLLLIAIGACAPGNSTVAVGNYTLAPRSSLVGPVGVGLRIIVSDDANVCGKFTSHACLGDDVEIGSGELANAIFLDVVLPDTALRKYSTDEAQVRFLAAHGDQPRFLSTPRSGSVTLVSNTALHGAVATYDLELDTGAKVKGALVGLPCKNIELVQPFGGIVCTEIPLNTQSCVGDVCTFRSDCSCNGASELDECSATTVRQSGFWVTTLLHCSCVAPDGTDSTCDESQKTAFGDSCCPRPNFPTPP